MRKVITTLTILALLGGLGAVAVVGIGLYNVSARAGHLPGVSWVLHSAYRNAIRLRAPDPDEVPPLDDPDMVALGARHFDSACAFCHAHPGWSRSATALAMEPPPPHIETAVKNWQPEHMFQIIYDGVKMTGMPHWPAARKDEVWAVVAYLAQIPTQSESIAPTPTEAKDRQLAYCAACHGDEGKSGNALIPRLDILSETYMRDTLLAYREGTRSSGFMAHAARQVSEADLTRLARHFASAGTAKPTAPEAQAGTGDIGELGAQLALRGSNDVPSCTACHGPERRGARKDFPALNGQSRTYLETQLRLWRDNARGGAARAELMQKAAAHLSDAEIAALALYYAQQPALRPE